MTKPTFIFMFLLGLHFGLWAQDAPSTFDQGTWDRLSKIEAELSSEYLLISADEIIQTAGTDSSRNSIGRFFKGCAYFKQIDIEKSYQEFQASYNYAILQQSGFPNILKGRIARELGTCLTYKGDYAQAKEKFDEAMVFCEPDPEQYAKSMGAIAKWNFFLGNITQALEKSLIVDSLLEKVEQTPSCLNALAGNKATIGAMLIEMGDTMAIEYLEKALNLSDLIYKNGPNEIRRKVLYSIAMYRLRIEDSPELAIRDFRELIKAYHNKPIAPVISAYIWLGDCYHKLNKLEEALSETKIALSMCDSVPEDIKTDWPAYHAQAGLYLAGLLRFEEANRHCDTALWMLQKVPTENKDNFFTNGAYLETWTTKCIILTDNWQKSKKETDLELLRNSIAETQKYFEAMRINVTDDQSAIEFTDKAHSRLEVLLNGLFVMDSLGEKESTEQAYAIAEQYKGYVLLSNLLQPGEKKIDTIYPNMVFGVYDVQTRLLDKNQTLIQYFVGLKHIYIFIIRKDEYLMKRVPFTKSFYLETQELIKGITGYHILPDRIDSGSLNPQKTKQKQKQHNKMYLISARSLYHTLLEPAENYLKKGTETIIVSDGVLGQIPFEVLLTTDKGQEDSIVDFASLPYYLNDQIVRYGWSATTLHLMSIDRSELDKPCTCSKDNWDFVSFEPFSNYSFKIGKDEKFDRLDFGSTSEQVSKIFSPSGRTFKDYEANIETFKQQASCAKYIMIPSHAMSNSKVTNQAFIAFAPKNKTEQADLLHSLDLMNSMNFCKTENVLLSACKTGVGTSKNGEGILSLGRAFALAGASSVTFTLWPISDKPSGEIFLGYYKTIKEKGQTNASALAINKRRMYDKSRKDFNKNWAHPFYWAGFLTAGK